MGDFFLRPDPNRPGELKWFYDEHAPSPSVEVTQIRPTTKATLDAIHGDSEDVPQAGDVGDWIDPNAPDPTPDEVTDENDPNFVHPWFGDR